MYCQLPGNRTTYEDEWQGVRRVNISVNHPGPVGTVIFDWHATRHAAQHKDLCLTLGYNTAAFCGLLRIRKIPNIINMDGIEWSRAKWNWYERFWLWANERIGCLIGDHLVADHPKIKDHLARYVDRSKISVIAYGSDAVENISERPLIQLGLSPKKYLTIIARPEPENNILEMVTSFSSKRRGLTLVVLGDYQLDKAYHRQVIASASDEVLFPGAIYEKTIVQALRFHSLAYLHGHQVGGTNPSLVEAIGCGNAVIAHDNEFNRWVAGDCALYFKDQPSFSEQLERLLASERMVSELQTVARQRYTDAFSWQYILSQYESLLARFARSQI